MYLNEIIDELRRVDQNKLLPFRLTNPHSYRGDYSELAFERLDFTSSVGDWVKMLKAQIGQTYQGYKGGEYTMAEYSNVFIAEYGSCGSEINELVLELLLK